MKKVNTADVIGIVSIGGKPHVAFFDHGIGYALFESLEGKGLTDYQEIGLSAIPRSIMLELVESCGQMLKIKPGGDKYRRCPMESAVFNDFKAYFKSVTGTEYTLNATAVTKDSGDSNEVVDNAIVDPIMEMIHNTKSPKELVISPIKWKYLLRSILRGKNIIFTGPSGAGKTQTALSATKCLNRQLFKFDMGGTQDPKSYLLGNMHYEKEKGTTYKESLFIKAIQTENACILLDELSRAHPDAWNILMPVLDPIQRVLILDEHPDNPIIKVAPGVSFIATANIGLEFTATRIMDNALMQRFTSIEMDPCTRAQNKKIAEYYYPNLTSGQEQIVSAILDFGELTLKERNAVDPKLRTLFSTRMILDCVSLVADGFNLKEIVETSIKSCYSNEGGVDSERTFVAQFFSKFNA